MQPQSTPLQFCLCQNASHEKTQAIHTRPLALLPLITTPRKIHHQPILLLA